MRLLLSWLALMCILLPAVPMYAQGPPDAIDEALEDLSTRAGVPITLNALNSWRWSQSNYPDTSLGCPQPGEEYEPHETSGYRFLLVYNGATYDYRVSANRQIVILCLPSTATITPTPPPATRIPPTPAPPPPTVDGLTICVGAMPTQVTQGARIRAREPQAIHGGLSEDAPRLGDIPPGGIVRVLDGPQCAERQVWWSVDYNHQRGWISEGRDGTYWFEPLPTAVYDLPAERQPITVQNASALQRLRELAISETIYALDWSPDGSSLAAAGDSGVWLYNVAALDQTPRHLQVPGGPTHDAAFSPDGSLLATAHTDGTVRVWDVIIGGQRSTLSGPTDPVRAVAFSGDGTLLAAAAGSQIWVWDAVTLEQRATLDDHTAAITALTFSPDSTLLASVDESGAVFLWDTVSLTLAMTAQNAPITALTFTPDSTRLLLSDTAIRLWDFVTGETITLAEMNASDLLILPDLLIIANANGLNINSSDGTPLTLLESGTASHHVILSPDGTVLADIATTIRLWGVISG